MARKNITATELAAEAAADSRLLRELDDMIAALRKERATVASRLGRGKKKKQKGDEESAADFFDQDDGVGFDL